MESSGKEMVVNLITFGKSLSFYLCRLNIMFIIDIVECGLEVLHLYIIH